MTNFTLKQLRYFEALAQQGHFGRAAEVCSISQPALSVQIKELEESLGKSLFERTPRRVRLTAFGEDFADRARQILRSVDEIGDMARAAQKTMMRKIRIGVIPTIAPYLLPALIKNLTEEYPHIDVHIRETITPKLLEELDEGILDTAILALPLNEPSLEETELFVENLVLVRPISEKGTEVPTQDNLRNMRLLMLEEGHCFRDHALSFCNLQPNRRKEGLDGTSLSTLVQMVGSGIGVTLIPEMAIEVEMKSARVTVDRFPEPQPNRKVGMVWRKTNPLADQLKGIADIVRNVGR